MATYTQMVDMVRDWSNRDKEVLSNAQIKTFINFAADNIYRDLRIVPLEYVNSYDTVEIAADDTETYNKLTVPSDAIEFIQLRKIDANSLTGYTVYSAKSDIRSFYQDTVVKYDYQYYTRELNNLIVSPDLEDGDQFELFYYRRLPEMDARYTIDTTNYTTLGVRYDSLTAADLDRDPDLASIPRLTVDGVEYIGALIPNWLRDQNEKLVLFGALTEAFTYLDEPAQVQSYANRFNTEMQNLNGEENTRKYMGGNVQLHYQTNLI